VGSPRGPIGLAGCCLSDRKGPYSSRFGVVRNIGQFVDPLSNTRLVITRQFAQKIKMLENGPARVRAVEERMTSKVLPNRLLHGAVLVTAEAVLNRNPGAAPERADRVPTTVKTLIGANLRSARIAVGVTLTKLAKRTQTTTQTLFRIELGAHDTKTGLLARIAHSLGSRVTDLTAGT
jgi:hypothetical protein